MRHRHPAAVLSRTGHRPPAVRRRRAPHPVLNWALGLCAALLLAACGTTPKPADETAAEAKPPAAPSATARAPQPRSGGRATRGGGYYKDDGPHDELPADLDDIADAEPRVEALHRFANRPYNVFGRGYVPATEIRPFRERGHASWYGRRFHGNPTSSGEPYDMYAMTAAHPTLPIPSYVRVRHVGNGRSVVVRVNDRGPFLRGRVIDLSYAAAHRLGYINAGSAEVEVEQILPTEIPLLANQPLVPPLRGSAVAAAPVASALPPLAVVPAAPAPMAAAATGSAEDDGEGLVPHLASASAGIFLQLGAFSSLRNARDFRVAVERDATAFAERLELFADGERFRLHAGPYDSVDAARAAAQRMGQALKLKPFVVVR